MEKTLLHTGPFDHFDGLVSIKLTRNEILKFLSIYFTTIVEECLVAYLSFDVVDIRKKTVFDEGPYGNDFTYNGDVQFLPANYSCKNAASINSDGDLYYSGSGFTNSPVSGATIALWVHPSDLLHKQSIFTTKAIGSKGGKSSHSFFFPK